MTGAVASEKMCIRDRQSAASVAATFLTTEADVIDPVTEEYLAQKGQSLLS